MAKSRRSPKKQTSSGFLSTTSPPKQLNVFQAQVEAYSGPVPDPETLERFEQIHPGAAKIVFTAFEEQGSHRRKLETLKIESDVAAAKRGQIFGLMISLIVIVGSFYLIHEGKTTTGAVLVISDLLAFATVFLIGRRAQEREREKRVKMLQEMTKQGKE
jgi:uncharacterized membrane protein